MAGFLILALIVAVVVWLADRANLRRRLDSIESAVEGLMRESAMNRAARAQSETSQRTAPAASSPPPFTPLVDTAVPAAAPPGAGPSASTTAPATESHAGVTPAWQSSAGLEDRPKQGDDSWTTPPIEDFPGLRQIREFFTGGNLIVRVGVVVLFFGIAFLLRYAAEHSHLSIEMRLSGVAAGAIVLLALGWHWRGARRGYALASTPFGGARTSHTTSTGRSSLAYPSSPWESRPGSSRTSRMVSPTAPSR